jgi:hypothetical protein
MNAHALAMALHVPAHRGVAYDNLPSPSAMAEILNRNGYRLRPVIKAKPQNSSGDRRHLCQHLRQGWTRGRWREREAVEHGLQGHGQYR